MSSNISRHQQPAPSPPTPPPEPLKFFDRNLKAPFTADELDAHFSRFNDEVEAFSPGWAAEEPFYMMLRFSETLPQGLGQALERVWLKGHDLDWPPLQVIVRTAVWAMRNGRPTAEAIENFDKHDEFGLSLDGRKWCACCSTCVLCGCSCHTTDNCYNWDIIRELEALGVIEKGKTPAPAKKKRNRKKKPRNHQALPTPPASPDDLARHIEQGKMDLSPPLLYTGTGSPEDNHGSSTITFGTASVATIFKDRCLLSDIKRLAIPVVFNAGGGDPIVARHVGTLYLRREGHDPIIIPGVRWSPDIAINVIGADVLRSDEWDLNFGAREVMYRPTGLRIPWAASGRCEIEVLHTGPGVCRPDK